MTNWLRQSTAVDIGLGPFLDEADGHTAETALTISQADVRLKKNGGAWAQKNQASAATHEENGWYEVSLDATDTNTLGILIVAVHEAGALPVWKEFMVAPAVVYDSMVAGSDNLQVDVTQFGGANGAFSSGRPEVNATHIAGAAVSPTTAQIGVNVVNAGGTAWNSGAIGANTLANDTITSAKIAANAIGASQIADGAIDAGALATDAITSTKIAANAIGSGQIADGAITANKLATDTITAAKVAPDAVAEIQSGLATAAALATVGANVDAVKVVTDKANDTLEDAGGGNWRFTTAAMALAPGAGALTAADVWTHGTRTLTSGANIALAKGTGVTGFNDLDAAGVRAAVGLASANLDTQLSAKASQASVDDLPTNGELATALAAVDDAPLAAIAALDSKIGTPAGASVSADIAGIQSDTNNIQGRLPATLTGGGNIMVDVVAVNGDATAAANMAKTTRAIARGTVGPAATASSIPTSAFSPAGATTDQFKGKIITFDADTATAALRSQSTDITGNTNAATPTLTVTPLTTAPASGDTFSVT